MLHALKLDEQILSKTDPGSDALARDLKGDSCAIIVTCHSSKDDALSSFRANQLIEALAQSKINLYFIKILKTKKASMTQLVSV